MFSPSFYSILFYFICYVLLIIIRRSVSTVDRKNEDRQHASQRKKNKISTSKSRKKTKNMQSSVTTIGYNEQITKSPNSRKYKQEITSFSFFSYFRIYHEENCIHSNKYRKRRKIKRSERRGIPSSIYINHSSAPPLDAAALFLYNTCYIPIYTETKASSVKFFSAFLSQYSSTLGRRPIMFFYICVCVCQCHEHLPNQDKTVDICMSHPLTTEPQHKRKKLATSESHPSVVSAPCSAELTDKGRL